MKLLVGLAAVWMLASSAGAQDGVAAWISSRGFETPGVEVVARAYELPTTPASDSTPSIGSASASVRRFFPNRCVGITGGSFTLDLFAGFDCASYAAPDIRELLDRAARPGAHVDPQQLAYAALDRALALAPRPDMRLAPSEVGLTGLRTYIWFTTRPETITAEASVPGMTVTAQAIPTNFVWDFGEGPPMQTRHHGRAWTKRRPGNIAHMYETRGRYDVSATIVYSARWNVNGGPWQPLGYFVTSDSQMYPVRPVEGRLVRTRR